jgi:O-antigen/teichoic acid export membrane protein
VAGLGIANSSVRQLAEAAGANNETALIANRRALFYATAALALVGGAGFWLLRIQLAKHVLGDPSESHAVGWLGVAVALTIISNSQVSLLNGLRRIGDMARVNVFGAILGTCLGIGALVCWGSRGIVPYVISAPLAGLIVGIAIVRRLPSFPRARVALAEIGRCSLPMIRLGFSFMVAALCTTAAFLAVRAIVNQRLGTVALGHFSAAWMISMTYIGFVLQAMGTDYYPRLTAAIHDRELVNRMVNEQTEVAVLLAAPVLLAMQAAAPWVIHLLYSSKFGPAVDVLRWQIMGDVLKIVSWPLGFIILASGNGRVFVMTETIAVAVYTGFVWFAVGSLGLVSTGLGFLAMYAIYLPVVFLIARRRTGFAWQPRAAWTALALFSAVVATGLSGQASGLLGLGCGLPLALLAASYALLRLSALGALHRRLAFLERIVPLFPVARAAATPDEASS